MLKLSLIFVSVFVAVLGCICNQVEAVYDRQRYMQMVVGDRTNDDAIFLDAVSCSLPD